MKETSDMAQVPAELLGQQVVLDMTAPYVFVGTLVGENTHSLVLEDADAHDLRDTSTTRDLYVLDCRKHGIGVNRKRVFVQKNQVVSMSKLADIVP